MKRWAALMVLTALSAVTCRPGAYNCKSTSDCAGDNVCINGACHRTCRTTEDCNDGTVCNAALVCVVADGGSRSDAGVRRDAGVDAGMDAAVDLDAGQQHDAAVLDAAVAPDAALGMDAGTVGDAASAADAATPRDAGVRACERAVEIVYTGPTVTGAVVRVDVPVFSPLQGTGGNLRFRELDGNPLSFWVQGFGGGYIVAHVRVPLLATGTTTIVAGGCGSSTDPNGSNGVLTFDYFSTLDPDDRAGWTPVCNQFTSGDEDCTVTVDNALPPPRHVEFHLMASCYGPLYNGVSITYGRTVNLPAGAWLAEDEHGYDGGHYGFCESPNGTHVTTSLVLGTRRGEDTCRLSDCDTCGQPWGARGTPQPATFDGGAMFLGLFLEAGDCATLSARSRFVRVRRALNPLPVVTVVQP